MTESGDMSESQVSCLCSSASPRVVCMLVDVGGLCQVCMWCDVRDLFQVSMHGGGVGGILKEL